MDISFIVPIYNTPEEKLRRCFESILKLQDINYEVILVDDGSKTYVKEICTEYTSNYNIFKYYYKENAGVSAARNFGIGKAEGKYIAFVDSDDEIVETGYDAKDFLLNGDLIIYKMQYKNKVITEKCNERFKKITKEDIFKWLLQDSSVGGPVAKLYNRKLITDNNIMFNETMNVAEDADFLCRILYKIISAYYIDRVVYLYDYVADSGNNRVTKYPEIAIGSYCHIYYQKLNALSSLDFSKEEVSLYKNKVGNDTINILAECIGILKLNKKLTRKIKEDICEIFAEIDNETTHRVGIKNMIYYACLKRKLWILLMIISKLRQWYQKYMLKI